jgi:hypothetical protein
MYPNGAQIPGGDESQQIQVEPGGYYQIVNWTTWQYATLPYAQDTVGAHYRTPGSQMDAVFQGWWCQG